MGGPARLQRGYPSIKEEAMSSPRSDGAGPLDGIAVEPGCRTVAPLSHAHGQLVYRVVDTASQVFAAKKAARWADQLTSAGSQEGANKRQ